MSDTAKENDALLQLMSPTATRRKRKPDAVSERRTSKKPKDTFSSAVEFAQTSQEQDVDASQLLEAALVSQQITTPATNRDDLDDTDEFDEQESLLDLPSRATPPQASPSSLALQQVRSGDRNSIFAQNLSAKRTRIAPPRLERVNGPGMVRPPGENVQQKTNLEALGVVVRKFDWPPLNERDSAAECFWTLRFLENAFCVRDYRDERSTARANSALDRAFANEDEQDSLDEDESRDDNADDLTLPPDLRRVGPGSKSNYRFIYSDAELSRIDAVRLIYDRLGLDGNNELAQVAPLTGNAYDIEQIEALVSGMIAYVLMLKRNLAKHVTLFPYQAQTAHRAAEEQACLTLFEQVNRDPSIAPNQNTASHCTTPRNVNQRLRTLLDRISNMRVAVRALNLIGSTNSRPHGLPLELAAYGLLDSGENMQVVSERDEVAARQQICSLLLQKCYVNNYRRCGDDLFRPVMAPGGHNTQAYLSYMSIDDFVWHLPDPISQQREWLQHTSDKSSQRWISEHLKKVHYESMLPILVRERDQWSFRNGIYVGHANRFYRYGKSYANDVDCPFQNGKISARYFDEDFDEMLLNVPANEIKTEAVELVQDSQKWSADVKGWMWVMFGRCFYNVGEYDDWQVAPYFKGLAGTGKSTLVKMMTKFYDPSAVGTLSNDMEETFGLMSLFDKHLLVAPEIRPNFKLPQAHFQTMVSGETMTVPVKHKDPKALERWLAPLICAGNTFPTWVDSGGSLARRILPFLFDEPVDPSKSITGLDERIERELVSVLVKANRYYFSAVDTYGDCNIWSAVPTEFLMFRRSMREATDNVALFLRQCPTISGDEEYYITLEQFIKSLRLMGKARDWRQSTINDADVLRSLKQTFATSGASKDSNSDVVRPRVVEIQTPNNPTEYRIHGVRLPPAFDVTLEEQIPFQ